jgi:hypothetical protein
MEKLLPVEAALTAVGVTLAVPGANDVAACELIGVSATNATLDATANGRRDFIPISLWTS